MGSKEKPLVFLSSSSSSDDDSCTNVIVPMKKSRGEKSRLTSGEGQVYQSFEAGKRGESE